MWLDARVRVNVFAESFFKRVCTADAEPSGRKATVQAGFRAWKLIAHQNIFDLLVSRLQFVICTKTAQEYRKTMWWY